MSLKGNTELSFPFPFPCVTSVSVMSQRIRDHEFERTGVCERGWREKKEEGKGCNYISISEKN